MANDGINYYEYDWGYCLREYDCGVWWEIRRWKEDSLHIVSNMQSEGQISRIPLWLEIA